MSAPAKRILYVEGNVDGTIGGSYFSLLFLVSGLDRRRFDPVVVFAKHNELVPLFNQRGVRTIVRQPRLPIRWRGPIGHFFSRGLNFLGAIIKEPLLLARLLRHERVALVHLNNSITRNHTWMIAALLARTPCVTHERGVNENLSRSDRVLADRLNAIICISDAVKRNLIGHGLGHLRLVAIHNGLDPNELQVTRTPEEIRRELGVPPATRLVGVVGNIKRWKGQELAIHAMRQLRDDFPDVACLLIGDTPADGLRYRQEIMELANDFGLASRVVITGYRRDVANYINALEILIHASIAPEPFGRVLLEGMALAKPLVASRAGAVPEIVLDNETGLLFEPGRADELADRVRSLLSSPALAHDLGNAGRKRLADQFTISQNVRQTESLYDSLL